MELGIALPLEHLIVFGGDTIAKLERGDLPCLGVVQGGVLDPEFDVREALILGQGSSGLESTYPSFVARIAKRSFTALRACGG